jgi:hypothetical protein
VAAQPAEQVAVAATAVAPNETGIEYKEATPVPVILELVSVMVQCDFSAAVFAAVLETYRACDESVVAAK